MPHRSAFAASLLAVFVLAVPATAQTGGMGTAAPITGLANVAIGGNASWQPGGKFWGADFGYSPFLSEHLQLGAGLSYSGSEFNGRSAVHGFTASANARYLFGDNPRSAPFVAASVNESAGQHQFGILFGSVAVGWLRFLTPLTAIDARISTAANSARGSKAVTGFSASPQAFVSGIFGNAPVGPQERGAFDWSGSVNIPFAPDYGASASANYDPFLASWFQVGVGGGVAYTPSQNGLPRRSTFSGNALVRAYFPATLPLQPFIDVFGNTSTSRSPDRSDSRTHGASIGARHYLSPELALDLRLARETLDNIATLQFAGGSTRFTSHITSTRLSLGLTLHQPAR